MSEHRCEVCPDCLHDGNQCCGCYDGMCCHDPNNPYSRYYNFGQPAPTDTGHGEGT